MRQQTAMEDITRRKIKSAVVVGGVGGAFWSFIGYAAYFMNFTLIGPSIWIKPFVTEDFLVQPLAHLIGIAVGTFLSILVAFLYAFTLAKYYAPWIGLGFGLALFLLTYYVINPLLALTKKPIHNMGVNTFTTEICLFLLFGLFIGFSLSVEYSSKEAG